MNQKTHYENDLFYLTLMIKTIDNSFKIKLDKELFFDKIVEEMLFIDVILQKLYTSLRDNKNLINREDYLHLILKAKISYRECIDQFLEIPDEENISIKNYFPQFERTHKTHDRDIVDIMNILRTSGESIDEYADITSRDEMSFLMSTIDTDDEDEDK